MNRWLHRAAASIVLPALIGTIFGTGSSLVVWTYQQARTQQSIRMAFAGEIEAILMAVRRPARSAAKAWEAQQQITDYKFYYPRAVFDGNVAHLGELRDQTLVRDVAYLYAVPMGGTSGAA